MNDPRPRYRIRNFRKLCVRSLCFLSVAWLSCLGGHPSAVAQTAQDQTVETAARVLDEIMAVPTQQIPQSLLSNAAGVAIFPNVVKGGFVVGLRHGRGVILVRDDNGQWQLPVFASLTGGSVGWQAGLQSTDVILVFKSRRSVNGLMSGKLTIGADAAAAAGPVGRQAAAATDARLGAEILSYSRSRGLFAGVSIDGSVIQLDQGAAAGYYGQPTIGPNGEPIPLQGAVPESAVRLISRLVQYTGSPQATAAGAPAMVPAATQPVSVTTPASPQSEAIRRQLALSWQRLSALLDDRWRAYLEPPREALVPGPAPTRQSLQEKIQHYAGINADPRYAVLNKAPEFAQTLELLKQFSDSLAPPPNAKLTLPPPPPLNPVPGNGTGVPNPRY